MPILRDIAAALEGWAPPGTAQSYDNVGLQVGRPDREVRRALVALDLTPAVIDEALARGAELVVTHHPLLFRPIRRLAPGEWVPGLALRLAREDVALYSIHTNLDAASGGVSFALAGQLGLEAPEFLEPLPPAPGVEAGRTGMGVVGLLPAPEPLSDFLRRVAARLDTPAVRYTGVLERPVRRVAVCGGSGSDLIPRALAAGADAFVTADVTYHRFFDVLDDEGLPAMALVDAGHYETERVTELLLADWLRARFPSAEWLRTTVRTSPIRVFVP